MVLSCQGNACEAGSAISVVGGEGGEYSEGVECDQRGKYFLFGDSSVSNSTFSLVGGDVKEDGEGVECDERGKDSSLCSIQKDPKGEIAKAAL